MERKDAQIQEALIRAAERAKIDKDKSVLTAQREAMDELGRLREGIGFGQGGKGHDGSGLDIRNSGKALEA